MTSDPMNYKTSAGRWRLSNPLAFEGHCVAISVVSGLTLALIGWLDYITGYEFGFFIFYFIPVAISAWYCGRREGMTIAVACAVCWYFSDLYSHHPYSKAFFIYWEMFMRLISFLTTALTLARIRELVLNEQRMIAELLDARSKLESLNKGERFE